MVINYKQKLAAAKYYFEGRHMRGRLQHPPEINEKEPWRVEPQRTQGSESRASVPTPTERLDALRPDEDIRDEGTAESGNWWPKQRGVCLSNIVLMS